MYIFRYVCVFLFDWKARLLAMHVPTNRRVYVRSTHVCVQCLERTNRRRTVAQTTESVPTPAAEVYATKLQNFPCHAGLPVYSQCCEKTGESGAGKYEILDSVIFFPFTVLVMVIRALIAIYQAISAFTIRNYTYSEFFSSSLSRELYCRRNLKSNISKLLVQR